MKNKELSKLESYTILIVIFGVILRFAAALLTRYDVTPHDPGVWPRIDAHMYPGHLGYIAWFFYEKKLPDFDPRDSFSLYNPPLHYLISAGFMGFLSLFGLSLRNLVESVQILTAIYSSLTLIFSNRIFKKVFDNEKAVMLATLAIALQPYFINSAALIGNDTLALMFSVMCIYFVISWYQEGRFVSLIGAALTLGLGGFTKLNVLLISPAIAYLFLVVFIRKIREHKLTAGTIAQFLAFGAISIPLGIGWSIRSKILFDVPLGYIDRVVDEKQLIYNTDIFSRFIPTIDNLKDPFINFDASSSQGDKCIPLATMKHALYDNLTLGNNGFFLVLLYLTIIGTVIFTVFSIIRSIRSIKKGEHLVIFSWIGILTYLIFFVHFCIEYNAICSQDFRYIAPVYVLMICTVTQKTQTC